MEIVPITLPWLLQYSLVYLPFGNLAHPDGFTDLDFLSSFLSLSTVIPCSLPSSLEKLRRDEQMGVGCHQESLPPHTLVMHPFPKQPVSSPLPFTPFPVSATVQVCSALGCVFPVYHVPIPLSLVGCYIIPTSQWDWTLDVLIHSRACLSKFANVPSFPSPTPMWG